MLLVKLLPLLGGTPRPPLPHRLPASAQWSVQDERRHTNGHWTHWWVKLHHHYVVKINLNPCSYNWITHTERALYCFECNLHALFNFSQGNCRLSYSRAENRFVLLDNVCTNTLHVHVISFRPFFIALFRHLSYVGRKGENVHCCWNDCINFIPWLHAA